LPFVLKCLFLLYHEYSVYQAHGCYLAWLLVLDTSSFSFGLFRGMVIRPVHESNKSQSQMCQFFIVQDLLFYGAYTLEEINPKN